MLKQLDILIGLSVVMLVVSLFITIITQIVSSLLGLRGSNLADALVAMIHKIDPNIETELAKKLADAVLIHPAVSDSTGHMKWWFWPEAWKRASAVRPEELLDVFKLFAKNTSVPAGAPTTIEEASARLLEGLAKPRGANAFDSAAIQGAIEEMRRQLPALAVQKGTDAIKEFEAATNVALGNVEKWFNATQDRAKQWFAMHTRIITVIASLTVAFGLQLDFLKLFARLSADPEFRARLVASTPALVKQTQDVFDAAGNAADAGIATNVFADLNRQFFGATNLLVLATNTASLSETDLLISNQLAAAGCRDQIADVTAQYHKEAGELSQKKMAELVQKFGDINNHFSNTGMELIANPYPSTFSEWLGCTRKIQVLCFHFFHFPGRHFLGLLLSAAFLSLGAPFWFNTLKSLTSLRPLLADQVDKQPSAAKPAKETKA